MDINEVFSFINDTPDKACNELIRLKKLEQAYGRLIQDNIQLVGALKNIITDVENNSFPIETETARTILEETGNAHKKHYI